MNVYSFAIDGEPEIEIISEREVRQILQHIAEDPAEMLAVLQLTGHIKIYGCRIYCQYVEDPRKQR